MPAAAHTEKNGSFTNTQRHAAVAPRGGRAGRGRAQRAVVHLPPGPADPRRSWPRSADEMDRPVLDLTWDYPVEGALAEPVAEAVLAEINGWDGDGKPLSAYTELKDDGSTACGCWIYCGVYAGGVNQAARRKPGGEQNWIAAEWGWAWPANRRILYNRASADPDGQAVERAQGPRLVGRRAGQVDRARCPRLRAGQGARTTSRPTDATGPAALAGTDPFIMQADGKAWLYAPAGLVDGPLPAHYEPQDSPVPNPLYAPAAQPGPAGAAVRAPGQPLPAERRFPRLRGVPVRGHHLPADRAPHRGRDEPLAALPVGAAAGVLLRGVPGAGRRARPRAPWLGHDRHRAQRGGGPGARHRRGCRR